MSARLAVGRADCGHFTSLASKPNAQDAQGRPLVLCQSCLASVKKKPRIEVKA